MRNWLRGSVFLLLGGMIVAEPSIACSCRQHKHDKRSFTVHCNKKCEDYRWEVNGTVVAHPQNSNQELVKDYGPEQITFKAVQTNVQYSCGRDTFSCEDVIPTSPFTLDYSYLKKNIVNKILYTIPAAALVITILYLWWKKERCACRTGIDPDADLTTEQQSI